MRLRDSLSELLVRTPTYLALEHYLRNTIPDNETRFRVAYEMRFYIEKNPLRDPQQHRTFRTELETTLGNAQSDQLFRAAHKFYNGYRLILHALKIIWFILFLLGAWSVGRLFVSWGWNLFASLLAAGFVTGALLELLKWAFLIFVAWRRS